MPLSPEVVLFNDIELHREAGLRVDIEAMVPARRCSCEYDSRIIAIPLESRKPSITRSSPISNHRPGVQVSRFHRRPRHRVQVVPGQPERSLRVSKRDLHRELAATRECGLGANPLDAAARVEPCFLYQ